FEPAFEAAGARVRIDIIHGDELIEVKSSTSAKEHYIEDAAFQTWVTRASGKAVSSVKLALVNSDFIYTGNTNYLRLVKLEDITSKATLQLENMPIKASKAQAVLASEEEPEIAMGPQCKKPYECPYVGYCRPAEVLYP